MRHYIFEAASLAETDHIAAKLAEAIPPGTVVALYGTLGAGKTRLVRAIAQHWSVDGEQVVSPTFVLCQQYDGDRTIVHFDAYRISDDDEFLELGVEERFDSPAVTFVEWADRVENCMPGDRLEIHIKVTGETSREFEIVAKGESVSPIVERLSS